MKHCAEAVNFSAKAKEEKILKEAWHAKQLQHEAALELLKIKRAAEKAKLDAEAAKVYAETEHFIFISGSSKKSKEVNV